MSQSWQPLARDNEHIQMEKRKKVLEDWHFFRMASINKRKGCRLVWGLAFPPDTFIIAYFLLKVKGWGLLGHIFWKYFWVFIEKTLLFGSVGVLTLLFVPLAPPLFGGILNISYYPERRIITEYFIYFYYSSEQQKKTWTPEGQVLRLCSAARKKTVCIIFFDQSAPTIKVLLRVLGREHNFFEEASFFFIQ